MLLRTEGAHIMLHGFRRSSQGSMAVEFGLLAPLLLLLIFGFIGFCVELSTASGLQQLAAEAARASIGGLTDAERTQIVQAFVTAHVGAYPFLDTQKLTVATSALASPTAFQVSLSYDLTSGIVGMVSGFVPMLPTQLHRSAIVLISSAL